MAKTPFKLVSGNNLGGRNGKGVDFKEMGSSPAKETIVESFRNFMTSKQTEEGRKTGDIKRRMRHSNIEVRMKAKRENRERLKKARGTKVETSDVEGTSQEVKTSKKVPTEGGHMFSYQGRTYRKTKSGEFQFNFGDLGETEDYSWFGEQGEDWDDSGEKGHKDWTTQDIEDAYNLSLETE